MSYRDYTTNKVSLPSFVAREIAKLSPGRNRDDLEEFVNSYCYARNYLEEGVERFHAYDATVSLCADLTKDEKEDAVTIVSILIANWYRQQGCQLI